MNLFYTTAIHDNMATLGEEEARHLKVLRKQIGHNLHFVDGVGGWYEGSIVELSKKHCTLSIQSKIENYNQRPYHIHLAIAPTKNINRFEWFLEKATEIGIDEITPLLCRFSERKNIRLDRLNKIVASAMKQSLKAYLPQVNALTPFSNFINNIKEDTERQLFIAHCQEGNELHLQKQYQKGQKVVILIGPEGDFSEKEIQEALKHHIKPINLGKSRLRTETAGIAATHIINLLNE